MLSFLPATMRGCIHCILLGLNTLVVFSLLVPISILKLIIPIDVWRTFCAVILKYIASGWVAVNAFNGRFINNIKWDVQGVDSLKSKDWYLVISNHQSWTDILVLQTIFSRRIPFLKFFLKKELIWVPVMGIAWWALDFPFMKRYSKAFLKKNPHLEGKDLETTQKACEKFKKMPVSIVNYVEGTRFTQEKHDRQNSPFKHLLKPKAGGIAFVMAAMGGQLHSLVNVTIAYPYGDKSFWDYLCGRIAKITVRVETLPIAEEVQGDYFKDELFRTRFQKWVNDLWVEKDALLDDLLSQEGKGPEAADTNEEPAAAAG
ncbi:acyltransferase [Desulfatibacillum aliphaticivorans]|uniref:acyltransferase n=1 Tax=Desulfatibacillum aliphaticivorans TaxID=218208 RepID=UPI00048820CF|nr:acyltransferase [Desulfatibacillum aliphaticivorans]